MSNELTGIRSLILLAAVTVFVSFSAQDANACSGTDICISDGTAQTITHTGSSVGLTVTASGAGADAITANGTGTGASRGISATSSNADAIFGDNSGQTTGTKAGVGGSSGSATGYGVHGANTNAGYGVYGTSGGGWGVYGNDTSSGYGVYGNSSSGNGVRGVSSSGIGVFGTTSTGTAGVYGFGGDNAAGVYGSATGTSGEAGVYGQNDSGGSYGVEGVSSAGYGVYGSTTSNVGIYGLAPSGHIAVEGVIDGAGSGYAVYGDNNSSSGYAGYFHGNTNATGCVEAGGSSIGGTCVSDRRLKMNIAPLKDALDKLVQLKGVTYEWKDPAAPGREVGTVAGFVAQDVEPIIPKWVGENEDGYKTLNIPPREFAAMTVEAFKTLKERAEKADARAAMAEAKTKDQDDRIERLEHALSVSRHPTISWLETKGAGVLGFAGIAAIGVAYFNSRRKRENEKRS